jgi:SAM-dependent methyltransferase
VAALIAIVSASAQLLASPPALAARDQRGGTSGWAFQSALPQRHDRLFPPQDLGLLEGPDRAEWQRPDQIMDALNIADGSRVADIGAGAGWFTMELARRVGPRGLVYARDVQQEMVTAISRRVIREGLRNVNAQRNTDIDPNLPAGSLDAVLLVDTFQELEEENRVTFLRNVARALKPTGRIGIVNYKPGRGGPGPEPERRVESAVVEEGARAAGLKVLARENLRYQYMIVLGPERSDQADRSDRSARSQK